MKNNKQGFSILLAMGITLVTGMIAILILEFIIPFSRNIKGVENSSAAFYQSYSGIEEALWFMSQNDLGIEKSETFNPANPQDIAYSVESLTSIIPPVGKGNSEYDPDWNRLDNNFPIQLAITDNTIDFSDVDFTFRIPDIDNDGNYSNNGTIEGNDASQLYIINWIITGISNPNNIDGDSDDVSVTLNGINNQLIEKTEIDGNVISIGNKQGKTLDDQICNVTEFINGTNACSSIDNIYDVTLKMTLVDALKLNGGRFIPYLEYQVDFGSDSVPGRYTQIETSGKSYGFKRSMEIKIPQTSTNQAFDFAVFQ